MHDGCEHTEGSPIGKCAICERTVCSECYREVFNTMICDLHEDLEDESAWELIGLYGDADLVAQRRFLLEDDGFTSLVVDTDEDAIEVYVPTEEKEDAYESLLSSTAEDCQHCGDCKVQFSSELDACPLCGVKPSEEIN